jgi:hypothetical protein
MSEYMDPEDSPYRLRRKDIRLDKFRNERDKPYAERKKLQKKLRARVQNRKRDPEAIPGSEEQS